MGVGNRTLSNAEIADRLARFAQLLSAQKENPYKVKAYQRAANSIRNLSDSVHELVQREADLTAYTGIGRAIDSAIREIVLRRAHETSHSLTLSWPDETEFKVEDDEDSLKNSTYPFATASAQITFVSDP